MSSKVQCLLTSYTKYYLSCCSTALFGRMTTSMNRTTWIRVRCHLLNNLNDMFPCSLDVWLEGPEWFQLVAHWYMKWLKIWVIISIIKKKLSQEAITRRFFVVLYFFSHSTFDSIVLKILPSPNLSSSTSSGREDYFSQCWAAWNHSMQQRKPRQWYQQRG